MARVKRGVAAHKRHKRLLAQAEGRRGTRSKLIRPAREALLAVTFTDRHLLSSSQIGVEWQLATRPSEISPTARAALNSTSKSNCK